MATGAVESRKVIGYIRDQCFRHVVENAVKVARSVGCQRVDVPEGIDEYSRSKLAS